MPETNNQAQQIQNQDFQIPSNDPDQANPNFAGDMPTSEMTANQLANQGQEPELSNAIKPSPAQEKQNQAAVFGKSELLNANDILTQILNLQIGNRVADLGAGGGLFTLQAARLVGDQGEVYAVDIMKTILSDIESKARMANLYNIKTVWSNIEILGATKIPEGTIDFALMVNVLFQSKENEKMLAEAARLVKQGGKLLIIDWSDTSSGLGPDNKLQIDPGTLINQAQKINLVLEQQFKAGEYHFGMVFIKQ